jgi:hypothetical protein
MNTILQKEWTEFQQHHQNIYNVSFHVVCGFLFLTCLLLLANKYSYVFLLVYSVFLLFTMQNLPLVCFLAMVVLVLLYFMKKIPWKTSTLFVLFLVFYFLPDLSHSLTNEPTVVTIDTITPLSLFTNLLYFLPFSIQCLSYTK